jgi:hypothetical protein
MLRLKEPLLRRPFRVPVGTVGLFVLSAPPLILAAIVCWCSTQGEGGDLLQVGIVGFGVAAGVLLYFLRRNRTVANATRPALVVN